MDASIQKLTHITERNTIEFRMEAGNVFNHPSFTVLAPTGSVLDSTNINSPTFGQITNTFSTTSGRREVQFGLYYRF
jgi:hypothetical protein